MGRWDYMAQPGHNPPNNDCPECKEPSKTYFKGGKLVGDTSEYTWTCEHHHRWTVKEKKGS